MLSGSLNGLNTINNLTNLTDKYGHPDEVTLLHKDDVLDQSNLVLDGRSVDAFLSTKKIYWTLNYLSPTTRKQKRVTHSISLRDVITVEYEQGADNKSRSNDIELFPSCFFSIHHARKSKVNRLKYQQLIFQCPDSDVCKGWVDTLQQLIADFDHPKNLLVFINPVGGKKEAEKVYRTKVAPLFDVAKIKVTKIVTEHMNHAKEYLQSEDITPYDGVIAVGGDGMFSEVMNGLLNYDDGEHKVLKSVSGREIVLGIIPAGSTDTVIYCATGCNDPTTAALLIILGDVLPMDVCSVWHDEQFFKYSVSLMAYGYFGDIIRESESFRWVGPKRYDFAGIKRFIVNKSYEGEIKYIGAKQPEKLPDDDYDSFELCKQGCTKCSTFDDDTDNCVESDDEWQTISGRFISVFGANISCRCARSSTGISPHAHIGDGHIYLVLVRKTTRARHLHHLIKVSEKTTQHFDFNFIEVYRVKEFYFKPVATTNPMTSSTDDVTDASSPTSSATNVMPKHRHKSPSDTSVWNIDGELVEHPHLRFRAHRQLIRLFARGIEAL